jgi:spectinomycin phosphotransferase
LDTVRNPPADLRLERLGETLLTGWSIAVGTMEYVPEGGGSHHWCTTDNGGRCHFVTVDDLDDKSWLGETRDHAFAGLCSAFDSARTLREAGLGFVVAPIPAHDGSVARRINSRYCASVYPFYTGHTFRFGPYRDALLRDRVIDMLAQLHGATSAVRDRAPRHFLGYGGQRDLQDFLAAPEQPWDGGPYSEDTRLQLVGAVADIADLVRRFEELVQQTAPARRETVITHGEPHPANLISLGDTLLLIDWDTAALAPRERDLSLLVDEPGPGAQRYQQSTGHDIDFGLINLYRLRWYLDDLGSAVRLFRHSHDRNPDTQLWWDGLVQQIAALPRWLALLEGMT